MKRIIFLFTTVILLTITCNAKEKTLKPILTIDGEKVTGKINSMIIDMRDYLFFFGENGDCVKTIKKQKELREYYRVSGNQKYLAIVENIKDKFWSNVNLTLYKYDGKKVWNKSIQGPITILGVSSDGSRVLVRKGTNDEVDFPTIIYFDEKGKELVSLRGLELEKIETDYAVSDDCRYWICKTTVFTNDQAKWLFFNGLGQKIKECLVNEGDFLLGIGNNGNYLTSNYLKDSYGSVLYDLNGKVICKNDASDSVLSCDGNIVFYTHKDFMFQTQKALYVISSENLRKETGNDQLILGLMREVISYSGKEVAIRVKSKSFFKVILINKDNLIKSFILDGIDFDVNLKTDYRLAKITNFITVWDTHFSRCRVFDLGE